MISSQPKSYAGFIRGIKVESDRAQKAKTKALDIANKIDSLKKRDPKTKMQAPEIIKHLNELAQQTAILAGSFQEQPPSVIEYGDVNADGGATWMEAQILSKKAPKGSQPIDKSLIWQKANRRKGIFVRAHLLNESLGGPGRAYNLTPVTIAANNQHKSEIESPLKQLVLGEKRVVKYRVSVQYGGHPGRSAETQLREIKKEINERLGTSKEKPGDKSTFKRAEKKLNIMNYEQNKLARQLTYFWQPLKFDGRTKKWVPAEKIKRGKIPNDLPDEVPGGRI